MEKKDFNKKAVLFIVFFTITIGNGKYILDRFGNKIEYIGLLILLLSALLDVFFNFFKNKKEFKKNIKMILLSIIMSIGAFHYDIATVSKMTILLSSLLLLNYSRFSEIFIDNNAKIKIIGDALIFGMLINSIIGILTGTLGLHYNSGLSFIKILFLSGMKVKNYCGGIWLTSYILYYVHYYINGTLKKHRIRFAILTILLLLSGSKGAILLAIIFLFCINYKKIFNFKGKQGKLVYAIIVVLIITGGVYVYNNFLVNISTYAYRMRGMNKLLDIYKNDVSKLIYGMSNIAYDNTGFDYTINMRNFFGWDASVEMAYVNILIKNGLLGLLVYFIVFKDIIKKYKNTSRKTKSIVYSILVVMLLSGFTETYIASIHYVVGPTLFCLINGIKCDNKLEEEK